MEHSPTSIAAVLDGWQADGRVTVTETDHSLIVDQLDATLARQLAQAITEVGWPFEIEDGSEAVCQVHQIADAFGPYRFAIAIPEAPLGARRVVTRAGLADLLSRQALPPHLLVLHLSEPFESEAGRLAPWNDDEVPQATRDARPDPRHVVNDIGEARTVVGDMRPWLLNDLSILDEEDGGIWLDGAFRQWAETSARHLLRSIASEVRGSGSLVFRGPPQRRLRFSENAALALGSSGFLTLQRAAAWIHETDREQEVRHSLFSSEFCRSVLNDDDAADAFSRVGSGSLDGAKIAYQLSLSNISRDALKAMADLRKAVADEAAKLSETTRQVSTAVAGAVFAGIGLVAARLTVSSADAFLPSWALGALSGLLALYAAAMIVNGVQFVRLQRGIRSAWRDRLYRFLPDDEYKQMVADPAECAEWNFKVAAWISALLTAGLMVAAIFTAFSVNGRAAPGPSSATVPEAASAGPRADGPGADHNPPDQGSRSRQEQQRSARPSSGP